MTPAKFISQQREIRPFRKLNQICTHSAIRNYNLIAALKSLRLKTVCAQEQIGVFLIYHKLYTAVAGEYKRPFRQGMWTNGSEQ
jgi:hypothetical protein